MNDIDIEDMRALAAAGTPLPWFTPDGETVNIETFIDAIETGRQWKTIARRLADAVEALLEPDDGQPEGMDLHGNLVYAHPEWEAKNALAAFRVLADRTPTPTDGA
jgi:hypothetical protein